MKIIKEGDLRVWWKPQITCLSFLVDVENVKQAKFLLTTLANYDLFQLDHNIKPDYSNAGGLLIYAKNYHGELEWTDWENNEGFSIDECNENGEYDDYDE